MIPIHLFAEIVDYSIRGYHQIESIVCDEISKVENSAYWKFQYQQYFIESILPANEISDSPTWKEEWLRSLRYKHIMSMIIRPDMINLSKQKLTLLPLELKNMPKLTTLYCSDNYINEIPYTLTGLTKLDCSNTQISKIPDTLTGLTILYCSNTKVKLIPDTLTGLLDLSCNNTKVKSINNILTNLKLLNCSDTKVKLIPDTLINLTALHCNNTQIEKIPNTLTVLMFLYCNNTRIKDIPATLINLYQLLTNYSIKIPRNIRKNLKK